ncbi:MAG: hypothetical protein RL456_3606, partial [Pseudomonadota bacterium]
PAVNPRDVLNKALSAQRAGKLHGGQVAEIEAHLNRGDPIPDYLARALVD